MRSDSEILKELSDDKKYLLSSFQKIFKDCKLFCIQLDGFSHSIYYKDKQGRKHIEIYSGYLSPCEYEKEKLYEDGIYRASNSDKAIELFSLYPNCSYQGRAKEICFEDIARWRD